MANRFLIVVDMQNDFIDGALGTKEAQQIVPEVLERIDAAKRDGETLMATQDTHTADYLNTSEGRNLPVSHCMAGTDGWKIQPDILAALGDALLVEKPTFGSTKLPQIIAEKADDVQTMTIELIGVCTDICVVSNALLLKAHFPEADIRVRAACCAGVTPEKHAAALETMRSCQIAVI